MQAYGNGQLADLGSSKAIAHVVNAIFSNPEQLEALRAGAGVAREFINWEVEGEKLLGIYQRLPFANCKNK